MTRAPAELVQTLNNFGRGYLPGLLGVEFTDAGESWIEAQLAIRPEQLAPNGYLHAGTVITLADTCFGSGCLRALPDGAGGFIAVELNSNFLGTLREGVIACRAEALHLGQTTQPWDGKVSDAVTSKTLAFFRCTQMVLWPRG